MAVAAPMIAEAVGVVDAAAERGVTLRLIGGIAIALHCDLAAHPHRDFADIDAITPRRGVKRLIGGMKERGYEPDARFNALNGRDRLIFYGPYGKFEVFVQTFEMCHRINLEPRLDLDSPTVSVTDLLLTKLQVVELTTKDRQDAILLIGSHEVAETEGDHVNAQHFAAALAQDWGLWRTVTSNLARMTEHDHSLVEKVTQIMVEVERVPKTRAFKLRAMVGEHKRWYELPEEVGDSGQGKP
jgi:hypothetical protein